MIGIKSKRRKGATKGLQRVVSEIIETLITLGIGIFVLKTLSSVLIPSTWNIVGLLYVVLVAVAILMYAYVNRANQGATGGGIV